MARAIDGTISLSREIFDNWDDLDHLSSDLKECCEILGIRTGLQFDVSQEQLTAVHTAWKDERAQWLSRLLPEGTKDLSHLKKMAILLSKICEFPPITISGDGYTTDQQVQESIQDGNPRPPLPNRLSRHEIRKFKDGGCYYIGWLLTYHVCEFFEVKRTDRADPFEARITEDFEIDMISGLLSAKISAQSIHLILKALFLRD